ncbi:hypothetical protein Riv7116_1682 [Rivularia sp. PCC 7116]|uniref:hypothetical protein n=1 Tax=Rivularia sp. PCC 7116 TaxID=373994 RepID=UPI00029EE000|nr:hypothetical protein [Rivularia sp. PCC 7116]AFY54231.1 hypothetical protein Riv7116_1682 [Rivularia sp. PCC 7116]
MAKIYLLKTIKSLRIAITLTCLNTVIFAYLQPSNARIISYSQTSTAFPIKVKLGDKNIVSLKKDCCNRKRSKKSHWWILNQYSILKFDIPLKIHELKMGSNSISGVPTNTTILAAANTNVRHVNYLPPGLKVLDVSGTKVRHVNYLPPGLKVLDVSGTNVRHVNYLPPGLKVLDVSGTNVRHVNYLPPGLKVLDVSGTKVRHVNYLPPGLKVLDVRNSQINSLSYIPSSVECVITDRNFRDSRVVKSPSLCPIQIFEIKTR